MDAGLHASGLLCCASEFEGFTRSWNEAHRHRGCGGEGLRVFASRMSASAGVSEGLADVSFD